MYQRIGHRNRIVSVWREFPQGLRQAFAMIQVRLDHIELVKIRE